MAEQVPSSAPSQAENRPDGDTAPMPADGGTLLPPPVPAQPPVTAPALNLASADTSLAPDTSHVQHLINHGADVNAPDNNGWTPLHTAAYHGQEEIVRILLNASANVNARNKQDETPLHLAAKWPQDRVVEALLQGGADLGARNKRGRTPAHVAALFNRHAILDRLLSAGADVNALDAESASPLHLAVRQGAPVEPELVKTLLRHSADLRARDVRGNTPLQHLPQAQLADWLHWAAYEGREELLAVLLARPGVRPDVYNEEGLTPLHLAAHANSVTMVTMLLNAGAKVNAPSQQPAKPGSKDPALGLPLPGAPGSITAGISIAGSLRAFGAAGAAAASSLYGAGVGSLPYGPYSASSKLPPGEVTALHIAAERGSAELVRLLVGGGARVNWQGERGMPPLHVAVWEGNTPAVVSLLAAKASVSLKSKSGGFTAVHCACLSSRATPELLGLLLENGGAAVLEERCQEGWTALHLACQAAPPAMVELLLQRGARPGAKGKAGRTAADCAAKRPEILQLLHVATGGKVPLPLGLAAGRGSAAAAAAASGSGGGGGASGAAGGGSAAAGLLPGTAAVLEPLESVEATLAALLADMGGALCSLQAGALFGGGCACCVDPVGHCIRPLEKRLVLACTLGCTFSFHLPCWKSAREVLKERWAGSGFSGGTLGPAGRYPCLAPGCPGYVREQTICDGAQMQTASPSRLYVMPTEVYEGLPPEARRPVGAAGGPGGCGAQGPAAPVQPALPAGGCGGGLPSLAALGPSFQLAQAMVQAAQAVAGNMAGGSRQVTSSQLAAALAATGGMQALLNAPPPPVPSVMSAAEAAAIAAETLGVSFGSSGGRGSSSCVVEEMDSEDEDDDEEEDGDEGPTPPPSRVTGRAGASASGGAAGRSGGGAAAAANGGAAGKRHGGGDAVGGAARRGVKAHGSSGGGAAAAVAGGSGRRAHGSRASSASSTAPPISSAAAAEMLQQLQGLQQAVAAVQSAVGAGVHTMGLSAGTGGGGGGGGSGGAAAAAGSADGAPTANGSAAAGGGGSGGDSEPPVSVATLEPPTLLQPVLPPVLPANCGAEPESSGAAVDGDSSAGGLEGAASVPPPRRRNTPNPMPRRPPPPLSGGGGADAGRLPVSPQLATPPPATSLLTPGVQQVLLAPPGVPPPPAPQPDASLAPILVGPVPRPPSPGGGGGGAAAASATRKVDKDKPSSPTGSPRPGGGSGSSSSVVDNRSAEPSRASVSPEVAPASPSGAGAAAAATSRCAGAQSAPPPAAAASGARPPHLTNGHAPPATAVAAAPPPPQPVAGPAAAAPTASSLIIICGTHDLTPTLAAADGAEGPSAAAAAAACRTIPIPVPVPMPLGGSSPQLLSQHAVLALAAGSLEPGGYARAVCPGLRPGVHRVTHSAGSPPPASPSSGSVSPSGSASVPSPPAAEDVEAEAEGAAAGAGPEAEAETGPVEASEARVEAAAAGAGPVAAVKVAAAEPAIGSRAGGRSGGGGGGAADKAGGGAEAEGRPAGDGGELSGSDKIAELAAPPSAAVAHGAEEGDGRGSAEAELAAGGRGAEPPAGPLPEPPAAPAATDAAAHGDVTTAGVDAAASHAAGRTAPVEPPSDAEPPTTIRAAAAAVGAVVGANPPGAAASGTTTDAANGAADTEGTGDVVLEALRGLRRPRLDAAVAAAAGPSRHLLLESGDIPLLAATPGMLEAWLNAHVASHGRLAAYRILAPQAAVAVTLAADGAAAAAAAALARRPTLLVAPLEVAPLEAFPEDEALAASTAKVSRARAAPGDRSWCGRMAELWTRLRDLPPPVHHDV